MAQFGLAGLIKEPGGIYKVELSGFATYDVTYSGVLPVGSTIPFLQGDRSTKWPDTLLMTISVTETGTQCEHVKIDLHYEGKSSEFGTPETQLDLSIDFTTSQEPIESHQKFVTDIGGKPGHSKHGAFFDATTGEFLGFSVVDPDEPTALPSRFAGVRSYLMPQETFTRNTVEEAYPTPEEIDNIGQVFDPGLDLPMLPGTRSWLNTGIRIQNIGNVYFKTQQTGMLSGPRNWVPEIYGFLD